MSRRPLFALSDTAHADAQRCGARRREARHEQGRPPQAPPSATSSRARWSRHAAPFGGAGRDRLAGNDRISGGAGNDEITVTSGGRDVVDCGPGFDRVLEDATDRVGRNRESIG